MLINKRIQLFSAIFYSYVLLINETTSAHLKRSTNSSEFIHHGVDSGVTTTQLPEFCRPQSDENNTETTNRKRRRRRSEFNFPILETNSSSVNLTEFFEDFASKINISRFSDEFEECMHILLEPECYIELSNGSVEVPAYGKVLNETDYFINDVGELVICPEFFDNYVDKSKFSPTLDTFSVVGTSLSFICINIHIIMFLFLKSMRNLPGYCLFSLCLALNQAYICYFVSHLNYNQKKCNVVGMIMFYSFLASFFWMNVMSYDVWRSLRLATAKLRLTADRPMFARFARYSAYSWGIPLIISIIALIVDSVNSNYRYNLIFNIHTCWFQYKQALIVYFATPFFIVMGLNVLLFVSSFVMITSASMNTVENKAALWFHFLIATRLAIAMGLTWICGMIAAATNSTVFWYIYSLLNTLQGVFIFLSFSFTKKTIKECKKVVAKKKSSFFPTQTSTSRGPSSSVPQETTF